MTREGNGSDVYWEQTALALAIQAASPGISGQGVVDVEADCLNCSLGNFSQLMMIKLYQEIFKAGNVFEKPEVVAVKRIKDARKKRILGLGH